MAPKYEEGEVVKVDWYEAFGGNFEVLAEARGAMWTVGKIEEIKMNNRISPVYKVVPLTLGQRVHDSGTTIQEYALSPACGECKNEKLYSDKREMYICPFCNG